MNRLQALSQAGEMTPGSATLPNFAVLILAAVSSGFWATPPVLASSSSANYRLEPAAFAGGASFSSSANYTAFSAIAGFVVGTSTSASNTAHYGFFPAAGPVDVTGRFVFYNRSAWDGNSGAANASDDDALAPDKVALLAGTATFSNYTSYSRGLNGVMVDLPNGASPGASDFTFRRGNTSTPAGWAAAPDPTTVAVREGAGVGGADRVTLIWLDNTIQKQWLQVTVLATANTGLATPDTFYFGNAIGETGDSTFNAIVGGTDESAIRAHPRGISNPAPIDDPYDINRDRLVGGPDVSVMRANSTGITTALRLIQLGAGDPVPMATSSPFLAPPPAGATRLSAVPAGADSPWSVQTQETGAGRVLIGRFRWESPDAGVFRVQASGGLGDTWRDLVPQPRILRDGATYVFEFPMADRGPNQFFRILVSNE